MTWDTTTPSATDQRSGGAERIRTCKNDVQTALKANDATLGDEGVFPGPSPGSTPIYRYRGLKGTTAQRPAAGNYGLYYNTTTGTLQRDNGSTWEDVSYKPRANISFGGGFSHTSDGYLGQASLLSTTLNGGFMMHRAGSIVGYTVGGLYTTATSPPFEALFRIRKNDSDLVVSATLTWTAANQNKDATAVFSSGTHTFVAGDRLQVFVDHQSGQGVAIARANLELELDS